GPALRRRASRRLLHVAGLTHGAFQDLAVDGGAPTVAQLLEMTRRTEIRALVKGRMERGVDHVIFRVFERTVHGLAGRQLEGWDLVGIIRQFFYQVAGGAADALDGDLSRLDLSDDPLRVLRPARHGRASTGGAPVSLGHAGCM